VAGEPIWVYTAAGSSTKKGEEIMSLLDKVRNALRFISEQEVDLKEDVSKIDVNSALSSTRDVVDEALIDPVFRTAAEQQYAYHMDNIPKTRELLNSPERIIDFIEREKELLIRFGASRRSSDIFFEELNLKERFPVELMVACSPNEIYQKLDKLRGVLHPLFPSKIINERNLPTKDLADKPTRERMRLARAGVVHATFGIGLFVANSSALAALLFAAGYVEPATTASFAAGGIACGRAYTRITEAMGL
jgi:hypothetical protein